MSIPTNETFSEPSMRRREVRKIQQIWVAGPYQCRNDVNLSKQ